MADFKSLIKTARGRRITAGVVGVATLGVGAFAAAAIDNSGEIRGCYDRHGRLRVLTSSNDKCDKDERSISWNKEGPIGPMGATGNTGPQGDPGAQGEPGTPGAPGAPGEPGTPGLPGKDGKDGRDGRDGLSCDGPGGGGGGGDPQAAAVDMFLKLDGIKGESKDADHKGEIEILSFSWGATNTGSGSIGGGAGAGKVNISDLSMTKPADSESSPLLFLHTANGKHIKSGVLTLRKTSSDGEPLEYLKITLTDVLVSSVNQAGSQSEAVPTESFSLNFTKVEFSYKGEDGASNESGWDLGTNKGG
jgi:type VI secretion system secreted protein Hcp